MACNPISNAHESRAGQHLQTNSRQIKLIAQIAQSLQPIIDIEKPWLSPHAFAGLGEFDRPARVAILVPQLGRLGLPIRRYPALSSTRMASSATSIARSRKAALCPRRCGGPILLARPVRFDLMTGVLVTGAGAIRALMGAALVIQRRRVHPPWLITANLRSSIPIRALNSPAWPSPASSLSKASPSAWMAKAPGGTMFSSNGYGAPSNTRRAYESMRALAMHALRRPLSALLQ